MLFFCAEVFAIERLRQQTIVFQRFYTDWPGGWLGLRTPFSAHCGTPPTSRDMPAVCLRRKVVEMKDFITWFEQHQKVAVDWDNEDEFDDFE